jgi:formylglycine-generating enzyme required for sulfatase activity
MKLILAIGSFLLGQFFSDCSSAVSFKQDEQKAENLRNVLVTAGFDDRDLARALEEFVRFGSHETAQKYADGDPFDQLEMEKDLKSHKENLKGRTFLLDKLDFQVEVRDDLESEGLVAKISLPMRVQQDSHRDQLYSLSGILDSIKALEVEEESAYLTNEKTLILCNALEAEGLLGRNGILYLAESRQTTLILRFRGDMKVLKDIFRNTKDYSVEIELTHLSFEHATTWGYYQKAALTGFRSDCHDLRRNVTRGRENSERPGYFITLALFGGSEKKELPQITAFKFLSIRVLDKNGNTIGSAPAPAVKLEEMTNSIGMKLVLIPKGTFLMGSPESEEGRDSDETQHEVTFSQGYYLGIHEVTQAQYEQVMGKNPSYFDRDKVAVPQSHPVEQVSWGDAVEFCKRLSELPEEKKAGRVYRLPTEAEWEYACRAGSKSAYSCGENSTLLVDQAWLKGNSNEKNHPVGEKKPNAWGLFDMHGNVWEWCSDWYEQYPAGAVTDPVGPRMGSARVFRGGCWHHEAATCRSAFRNWFAPSYRNYYVGFRIALSPAGIPKELSQQ